MAQLGNTYTGKFADMPTHLTTSHMYYASDVRELYGFDADKTPIKLAPNDKITAEEVHTIIQNFLVSGEGVTLMYDPELNALVLSAVGENVNIVVDIPDDILSTPDEAGIVDYMNNLNPPLIILGEHNIYLNIESTASTEFDYEFDFELS